jgi:hypothetical protein
MELLEHLTRLVISVLQGTELNNFILGETLDRDPQKGWNLSAACHYCGVNKPANRYKWVTRTDGL